MGPNTHPRVQNTHAHPPACMHTHAHSSRSSNLWNISMFSVLTHPVLKKTAQFPKFHSFLEPKFQTLFSFHSCQSIIATRIIHMNENNSKEYEWRNAEYMISYKLMQKGTYGMCWKWYAVRSLMCGIYHTSYLTWEGPNNTLKPKVWLHCATNLRLYPVTETKIHLLSIICTAEHKISI
jgi:hypothetical protein